MADTFVIPGDMQVQGNARFGSMTLPTNSVTDASVIAGANIAASKLEHQYISRYSQKHGVVVATERNHIHTAKGAGTIQQFRACLAVPLTGDGTAVTTVKLYKNGADITSAQIAFTTGTAAFASLTATLSSLVIAATDVFEVVVTATANTGTLGQGLYVTLETREAA